MKISRVIRVTMLLVSVGVSAWQAPRVIALLDATAKLRGGAGGLGGAGGEAEALAALAGVMKGGSAAAGMGTGGSAGAKDGAGGTLGLPELQAALQGLAASGTEAGAGAGGKPGSPAGSVKPGPDDLVVFSPNGAKLTEAQRKALLRDAARQRPAPKGAVAR